MYSSLRKIDIVAADPAGTKLLVQTDHRGADEVEGEADLSVIFALTRILLPQQSTHGEGAVVRYAIIGSAHPRLVEVAASTGATLEASGASIDLSTVPRRAPEVLADEAFAGLARLVLEREGLSLDDAGLGALEASLAGAPTEEEDEIAYWTAVTELAAVTGEVIRKQHGGQWAPVPPKTGMTVDIPFLFQVGDSYSNPVGKAVKFLMYGEAESPRQLLVGLQDRGLPDGPLLFNLKPSSYDLKDRAVCEPLLAELGKAGADVPLLVYGRDQPHTFASFMQGDEPRDMLALRREALENLASQEVSFERVDVSGLRLWIVHGSYFASEKILDMAFMQRMHREVGSQLMAAGIPEKGRLLLTDAGVGPDLILGFMSVVRGIYEKNENGRQISPTVFLVSEGELTGVAKAGEAKPVKKKGWLSRWFS